MLGLDPSILRSLYEIVGSSPTMTV